MVKNICTDLNVLNKKSISCTALDINDVLDLKDTLIFNKARCVGMALNMIGINKRAIAIYNKDNLEILINPLILRHSDKYEILEEGCLSLNGVREAKRYNSVTVEYLDLNFKKRVKTYSGFSAEIVQHEMDHLDGIII